jgi:hypothetical protein
LIEKLPPIENYSNPKKNGKWKNDWFYITKKKIISNFRLNISGNTSRLDSSSVTTTSSSRTQSARKRPRFESIERPSFNSQLLDGINIIDDDSANPKYVKLTNNSNQEVALNGWVLKRKVGSQLYEFKFPKGMILKAGATTTVRRYIFW